MKKKTRQTINRTIVAIAIIVLGLHLIISYMSKVLPFGIESDSLWLWIPWGYGGFFISIIVLGIGFYLLLYKQIMRWDIK